MSSVRLLDPRVATAFYGNFPALRASQEAAIEPILEGRDLILSSGTGTGKTEAVTAPLVSRLWRTAVQADALAILHIAPTKALVNDLERRLYPPLTSLGLRVGVRHGDRDDLKSGRKVHHLVTTPESLDVLLFRKDVALLSVQAVVIDEVHLLYNSQRGLQLSILLQRLRDRLPHPLQWAALSATIAHPPDIVSFIAGSGADPVCLSYPANRVIDAQIRHVPNDAEFSQLIRRLMHGSPTKLLIFARFRRECDRLAAILQGDALPGHAVFVHYSSMSPELRRETESRFASLDAAVCVATSTLELGIDIGDISAVILWGVPSGIESFLQSIGRGNRREHKTNVVCLVPSSSASVGWDALRFAALLDLARRGELPRRRPYELYGAVVQQMLNVIASDSGRFTRVVDLCQLVRHKPYLYRSRVEAILAHLARTGLIQAHGFKNQYGALEPLHKLVDRRSIFGNFPAVASSEAVNIMHGAKRIGTVPESNLDRVYDGACVRFGGKTWRVHSSSSDRISLVPSRRPGVALDFTYSTGRVRIDGFVAEHVWRVIHASDLPDSVFSSALRSTVQGKIARIRALCMIQQIPWVREQLGIRYFTFAGCLINRAVGLISGQVILEADNVSLLVPSSIDWAALPCVAAAYEGVFPSLFETDSDASRFQSLLPPELQLQESLEAWLKDETVTDTLKRLVGSSPVEVDRTTFDFFAGAE